ncbi:ATP-dependent 6-phosphofructokinase [Thalassospira marina]|uniref:ATP-dependent 6-phosphofructokinase n=1 Tax=Thalassospira marina TaxID=2048283 RepID=A0A2N3KR72_9PROT|nr:ATP-dependent 6-phosphofructokinase [Thalassospira marina]AUG53526.1 6-phosphofructokinase [Thalassospira marina]PKR53058.1 6-phosphofructokinase [Thalassospira marina]
MRIGILTSGGDCAGLNAVILAVVRRAVLGYGWDVVGIRQGTHGLLQRPPATIPLNDYVNNDGMLRLGGTILGTINKGNPFHYPMPDGSFADRSDEVIAGYEALGLDALIGIGGDGSMAILRELAQKGGINLVGIPKTIDNDLAHTEYSVGFTTAVNVAVDAMDRLQPTAASHERIMILEVMGRDAGHIALFAGIAGGADVILIPEMDYDLEDMAQHCLNIRKRGRNHALVIVAEAIKTDKGDIVTSGHDGQKAVYGGVGHWLAEKLGERTGWETRVTVLGHLQRGGTPSPRDRLIASTFGVHAVDLIAQQKFDRVVAWQQRRVVDVPMADVITGPRLVDTGETMVSTAIGLGAYMGTPPMVKKTAKTV